MHRVSSKGKQCISSSDSVRIPLLGEWLVDGAKEMAARVLIDYFYGSKPHLPKMVEWIGFSSIVVARGKGFLCCRGVSFPSSLITPLIRKQCWRGVLGSLIYLGWFYSPGKSHSIRIRLQKTNCY